MKSTRRHFIQSTLTATLTGAAALGFGPPRLFAAANDRSAGVSCSEDMRNRACISAGDERTQNIIDALKPFAKGIKAAIGSRPIVIKPNNVGIDVQLCATHVDALTGILEFLKSIGRTDNIVIAESAAAGPTFEGFENYGYMKLKDKYSVDLVDLDKEPIKMMHVLNDGDFHPHFSRMSKLLLDPETFLISAAVMKTHDRVVATLSLKNIVFGAPIKDEGFRWGRGSKPGAKNDKPLTHGGGYKGINYNLFQLSRYLHPDLAVIDGFQGMEGNGPVGGTPVDHKVAVAALDWFAADRTAIELMGIDFADVGYLNYCANAGIGEGDITKIEQLGKPIANHIKKIQNEREIPGPTNLESLMKKRKGLNTGRKITPALLRPFIVVIFYGRDVRSFTSFDSSQYSG